MPNKFNDFYEYQKKVIPAAFGLSPEDIKLEDLDAEAYPPMEYDELNSAGDEFKPAKQNEEIVLNVNVTEMLAKADSWAEVLNKKSEPDWAKEGLAASESWKELKKSFWQDSPDPIGKLSKPSKPWAKKIMPGLVDLQPMPAPVPLLYDKQIDYVAPIGGFSIEAKAAPKPKKPRYPAYKKDDRVNTPEGPGNVWSVDRDGTVCVELDSDPSILHEFEKKELKKIKK